MEKEFVTYERALALKELGFDEPCFAYYQHDYRRVYTSIINQNTNSFWVADGSIITAPTYSQAFRWFRDRFKLHSYIEGAYPWFRYYINSEDDRYEGHKYLTYEEAESACIDKLIGIVKKNS